MTKLYENAELTAEALKASGYVYNNGNRDLKSFEKLFGFDPRSYPSYFRVSKGMVYVTDKFRTDCNCHFTNVQYNFRSLLGV